MNTNSAHKKASRAFLPIAIVVLLLLLAALYLRNRSVEPQNAPPDDGLTYAERAAPLVQSAESICVGISTNAPLDQIWRLNQSLQKKWPDVRTARGYNPLLHDGFIVEMNGLMSTLNSGEIVWKSWKVLSDQASEVPEKERTSLLLALLAIHGVETSVQLTKKTGMDSDQLLSRTNLATEVKLSLKNACDHSERAAKAYATFAGKSSRS